MYGRLFLNSRVEKIIVENGRATGIKLNTEKDIRTFDYIIPAIDINALLRDLLEGKYPEPYFEQRFADAAKYPVISCTLAAIGVETELRRRPHSLTFKPANTVTIGGAKQDFLTLKHYAYDPAFSPNGHTLTEFVIADFGYDYWDTLRKKSEQSYQSEKTAYREFAAFRVATSLSRSRRKSVHYRYCNTAHFSPILQCLQRRLHVVSKHCRNKT
jgi:phytoene dehydrogenase-like protein